MKNKLFKILVEKTVEHTIASSLHEKKLTGAETKKREKLVKGMKKSKKDFKKRYGKEAEQVMYATATARAKDLAEAKSGVKINNISPQHSSAVIADAVIDHLVFKRIPSSVIKMVGRELAHREITEIKKAKKDYDEDGKIETPEEEYKGSVDRAIKQAKKLHEQLTEAPVDKEMEAKINEFGELSDKMDRLKSELEQMKSRYGQIENELRPLLEQLTSLNERSLETKQYLVTLKRAGYDRENYKYKEAFEEAITKVNKQTRAILEGILQSTKSVSKVASSIGVQQLKEAGMMDSVKGFLSKITSAIKKVESNVVELGNLAKLMTQ